MSDSYDISSVAGAQAKLDLYGSTFTRGVDSFFHDHALRRGRVQGIAAGTTGLSEAVNTAYQLAGNFHHLDTSLPLSRVKATRWGPSRAWVDLEYRRSRSGQFTLPAEVIARFRLVHEQTMVYRTAVVYTDDPMNPIMTSNAFNTNGFPAGDFYKGFDPESALNVPRQYIWYRPEVHIIVPTILPFNPLPDVAAHIQRLNVAQVTFGGHPFDVGTIRFDGLDVDWEQTAGGSNFYVDYQFTALQGGHRKQDVHFFRDMASPDPFKGQWVTTEEFIYDRTWSAGTFPVH